MGSYRLSVSLVGAFSVFAVLLLVNAWVVDDAYITLRTVDNFVNGFGLRWNVAERVQSFTHPLWLMLITPFYWLTREGFYTLIGVSVGLSLTAVVVAASAVTGGFRTRLWNVALLLAALASCKAFIDYTTSGLENPVAYLILVFAWTGCLTRIRAARDFRHRDLGRLAFLASLAFLTHPDLVLLFLPALAVGLARLWREPGRVLRLVAVATLPATVWLAFSIFYYGFPFPNTAYAKALVTGLPATWRIARGVEYLMTAVNWDPAAFAAVIAALGLAIVRRRVGLGLLMLGVLAHVAFVVLSGAAATHMGGRLFAVSLFVTWVALVDVLESRRTAFVAIASLALVLAVSPASSVKFGTRAYGRVTTSASSIDTKYFAYQEGAALINWRPGLRMPSHAWYRAGEAARTSPAQVHVGGAPGSDAIGYFGFAAGPKVFIIDRLGLSDPLLARLPIIKPAGERAWKSGHFPRAIPDGYVASVLADRNLITDPDVSQLYEVLRIVTRGPLMSLDRLGKVPCLNGVCR